MATDPTEPSPEESTYSTGSVFTRVGITGLYVSLAIIYLWSGAMKFTSYEATNVEGFVVYSPLISWMYSLLGVIGLSDFVGGIETFIGLTIAGRILSPKLSVAGGIMSALLFFMSLTFMLSTPGVFVPSMGFPAITIEPGQYLLKDLGLFVASLLVVGDSLTTIEKQGINQ